MKDQIYPAHLLYNNGTNQGLRGVSAQPVMDVTVSKIMLDPKKGPGIICQLYEARLNNSNFDKSLKNFMTSFSQIDPKLGVLQVCSAASPSVETQLGKCHKGSYGSCQFGLTEANFDVWENVDTAPRQNIDMAAELPAYPSFPLSDHNIGFDLPTPDNLKGSEKEKLNSLKVRSFT